jgi:S-adenosylmethionine:tRNA ribosyltransferase-isomerase
VRTAGLDYDLPEAAIAQQPVEPRHASRLFDTRDLTDHTFIDLPVLLEPGDLVVVNATRVRRARLRGTRVGSGGAVEALLLERVGERRFSALVRPARRIGAGSVVRFGALEGRVLTDPVEGKIEIEIAGSGDVESAIETTGEMPLPPYIRRPIDDPGRYQTVYADRTGSSAAPTAGLHVSEQVLAELRSRGIGVAAVDLEVGVDTFRPITTDEVEDHAIHRERYRLSEDTAARVEATREAGGRVVALGTTVVRVLETAARSGGIVEPSEGTTELFILPGFRFNVVDLLVTNFHLPRSTLIALVAAFVGSGWRAVYAAALKRGYRFLSFGDAMLAARRSPGGEGQ